MSISLSRTSQVSRNNEPHWRMATDLWKGLSVTEMWRMKFPVFLCVHPKALTYTYNVSGIDRQLEFLLTLLSYFQLPTACYTLKIPTHHAALHAVAGRLWHSPIHLYGWSQATVSPAECEMLFSFCCKVSQSQQVIAFTASRPSVLLSPSRRATLWLHSSNTSLFKGKIGWNLYIPTFRG